MSANVLYAKAFKELAKKQMENAENLLTGRFKDDPNVWDWILCIVFSVLYFL
jgi:hypothetical protein